MVDGLNETGHGDDGDEIVGLEFPDAEYQCQLPAQGEDPGGIVPCASCGADSITYTVDIASIPFDTTADYFAVRLFVAGPTLQGSPDGCRQSPPAGDWTPGQDICGPGFQRPFYDGEITGQPDSILTFNAIPVDPTFSAVYEGGLANVCQKNWPDMTFPLAWLVNPSPVWPFPDSQGNLFGQCLFTLAQLPSTIELTIAYFDHLEAHVGRWGVSVREYRIGETETFTPYTSYVWAA